MDVGIIGLGKMGLNLALNMLAHGHNVAGYDLSPANRIQAGVQGIKETKNLQELANLLPPSRVLWLMVPAGDAVETTIEQLASLLDPGDIIIDGGNSYYRDSIRRYQLLQGQGINFLDIGASGGISGARHGICAMVGGEAHVYQLVEPLIKDICVPGGYLYTGQAGTGHFVKMVHNGIEYGVLQAMGEGFELMAASTLNLDLARIAGVWNHGSVIRSWLMELIANALAQNPQLAGLQDVVHSSGEGLWTALTALEMGIPAPIITQSVFVRYRSVQAESFAGKVIAALRREFGGHSVEETGGR